MEFLNVVPNPAEPLTVVKITLNPVMIFIGLLLIFSGSALSNRYNRLPLLINALGAGFLLMNSFSIFRMIPPGIVNIWGIATLLVPFILLIALMFTPLEKFIEDSSNYLLTGAVSIGVPLLIAYSLDKINEQLASIPATWGMLIIAVLGIFSFTSET